MRRMIAFDCAGDQLFGTLDMPGHLAKGCTGLLIVSGGNEIRSGAYAGQSAMAAHFASLGYPVFRYDRRGIGESAGVNQGFENSADDIAAALAAFRREAQEMQRLIAFGNCDAASALILFAHHLPVDALLLANPWVIDSPESEVDQVRSATTNPAAIRARYWNRLKNPRSLIDLLTGKIDLAKLLRGLIKASEKHRAGELEHRIAAGLTSASVPALILAAQRDTTAMAFLGAWRTAAFTQARTNSHVNLATIDSASHSFADPNAKIWLYRQIENWLRG
jgi:exosortase A-associated hydrolase 1